jgi:hypothetical protein
MNDTIFTDKNLLKAYLDCRKTKRHTANALKYELDLENNLSALKDELLNRTYQPGRSICFVVTVPKPREIFAAQFGDRVVHHVLINQVQSIWEKHIFIPDSYACRPGRGHHYGMRRLFAYAKTYPYYGLFDIANFFGSIDKSILFDCVKQTITQVSKPPWWKDEVLWLAHTIIFHNPAGNYFYKGDPGLRAQVPAYKSLIGKDGTVGMPIGNLTSQFLANVYLHELDAFVTQTLGIKGYGRYVDDFVIFADSKEDIRIWRKRITFFLIQKLHLTLHPRKAQIQPTRHGIPFVGYFIKPWGITVRRNVVKTLKRKMYRWNIHYNTQAVVSSLNSYYGHFGKAKTARLRRHLIEAHMSPELKTKIVVIGNWQYIKLR